MCEIGWKCDDWDGCGVCCENKLRVSEAEMATSLPFGKNGTEPLFTLLVNMLTDHKGVSLFLSIHTSDIEAILSFFPILSHAY